MRYCTNCGYQITDDTQKFCLKCGAALQPAGENPWVTPNNASVNPAPAQNNASVNPAPTQNNVYVNPAPAFPMKWFKFLINFALFFGAFLEVCFAINYMTGSIYFSQTNGQATAEMVYGLYGTTLKGLDVVYGLFTLSAAVFSIITRFRLAKYKANGPMCLYILYVAGLVASIVYSVGVSIITGLGGIFNSSFFTSVIATTIVVVSNYVYFEKRKKLFCN